MTDNKFSYNKLWIILYNRNMTKKALMEKTNISKATLAKMKREESVSLNILARICKELGVELSDVVELKKELFE